MSPSPEVYHFSRTSYVPNSRLPVLVYRDVLPRPHCEETTKNLLESNEWIRGGTWGAIPRHHFHPNSHECYAVFQGSSTLLLGVGPLESEESGQTILMNAGDVIVLPAGVSHCSKDFNGDYRYVGVYPKGSPKWKNEYCRDESRCDNLREEVEDVGIPHTDPVAGHQGPLCQLWA